MFESIKRDWRRKRRLRGTKVVHSTNEKAIRELLPYA